MKPRIVLDSSVALSWVFQDETSEATDILGRALERVEFVVPEHWPIEIANALVMAVRRNRCSSRNMRHHFDYLFRLRLRISTLSLHQTWHDVVFFAEEYKLTVYDAMYLELAFREKIPLVSLDREIINASQELGIPRFDPNSIS
jgi:predicted nucleic acid-binding protein